MELELEPRSLAELGSFHQGLKHGKKTKNGEEDEAEHYRGGHERREREREEGEGGKAGLSIFLGHWV